MRDGLTATGLHFGDRCAGCYGWMPMTYLYSGRAVFAENGFFFVALETRYANWTSWRADWRAGRCFVSRRIWRSRKRRLCVLERADYHLLFFDDANS